MKEIDLIAKDIYLELKKRISPNLLRSLARVKKSDMPKVVYTSFDGDLLSFSELMKQHVLKKNHVPLNPESALGTYLVSNHYRGEKFPIIQDCLSLMHLCDDFWIMLEGKCDKKTMQLSEGVLSEALYWLKKKNSPASLVRFLGASGKNKKQTIQEKDLSIQGTQKTGIMNVIKTKKTSLRKPVYILAGEIHAKHSDWMRKKAFNDHKVPVCCYTLLNSSTLCLAYKNNTFKKILARVALGIRMEESWIFGKYPFPAFSVSQLETDVLTELFLLMKLKKNMSYKYGFFGHIGVPKYVNRKKWAITELEKNKHNVII